MATYNKKTINLHGKKSKNSNQGLTPMLQPAKNGKKLTKVAEQNNKTTINQPTCANNHNALCPMPPQVLMPPGVLSRKNKCNNKPVQKKNKNSN